MLILIFLLLFVNRYELIPGVRARLHKLNFGDKQEDLDYKPAEQP